MEKLLSRVEIGNLEILAKDHIGNARCKPLACPVRRTLARFIASPALSLEEAKLICSEEELIAGNDFYGAGQPLGCLDEAGGRIFIADCNKKAILKFRICGSLLIDDSSKGQDLAKISADNLYRYSGTDETVDFIKARWMKVNKWVNISNK